MAGDIISAIGANALNEVQAACENAAKKAAKKIKPKFKEIVIDNTVKDYYEKKPKIYKRTESLYNAMRPKVSVSGTSITTSIDYDSDWIGQHYSNSWWHQGGRTWINHYQLDKDSQDNGMPESDWILSNFFQGIHPGYKLDTSLGVVIDHGWTSTPALDNIRNYWRVFETKYQDAIIDKCILEELNKL